MHTSRIKSCVLTGALVLTSRASATAAIPRAIPESPLDPWVSVDASGVPVATVTPVLSTINGVETTIGAAPASLTAITTTSQSDSKPTETSAASGGGAYQVCHNLDSDFAPMCKPDNGSAIFVGQTYYITWDPTYFAEKNSTLQIFADYLNTSFGGQIAFQSTITSASAGFSTWTIDKEMLQGLSSNNVTLWINPLHPIGGESRRLGGISLEVTKKPADYYRQPKTQAPKGESLYIALPTVFGFIILCVCGSAIWNRKQRKIGLGNVMGRRNGYGVGKSRSQRLGLRKKKERAVQLRDIELTAGGQYRDAPPAEERERHIKHGKADSDILGSLAGTPTAFREIGFQVQALGRN